MSLPGTSQVKPSSLAAVSLPFFCYRHQSHIPPVWIAGGGEVLPACLKCLQEEIPDPIPAKEITSAGFICMHNSCRKFAPDHCICGFCGMHYCEDHYDPKNEICDGCEAKLL